MNSGVAVRVEGVGGALRQCVYQLKYRHLLLRNSVFFRGVGECVCTWQWNTHTCARTQKWKEGCCHRTH